MIYTVNDNGVSRPMTPEEIRKMEEDIKNLPSAQPSPEQEIAELKKQNAEMRRIIENLEYNAIGGI